MMKKALSLLLCIAMILGVTTISLAEEAEPTEAVAYLMFADGSWTNQRFSTADEIAFAATDVVVDGPGTYTVGLTFDEPAEGLSFMALGIEGGEALLPGAIYEVTEVKVDGEAVALGKSYTSTDEGVVTRNNLYNEWVGEIPEDARVTGDIADYTPTAVSKDDFTSYSSIEVTFTMVSTDAFIMFADAAWNNQLWSLADKTTAEIGAAKIYKEGDYEVSLTFPEAIAGFAFMALEVVDGNITFPNYCYDITEILVDGEAVDIAKGYTSSDDNVETRSNIYNEWVAELPADARTGDGDLEGCSPVLFAANEATITEITVKFTVTFVVLKAAEEESKIAENGEYPAFLMIADDEWGGNWANQKPGTAGDTVVTGDGVYEVKASKESLGIAEDATFGALAVLLVDIVDFGSAVLQTNGYSSKDTQYIDSTSDDCILTVKTALYVDGVKTGVNQNMVVFGNIEGNHRLRIELFNIWGPTANASGINDATFAPMDEVSIVFSIEGSGINTGADTDIDAYCMANHPQ
ncbi:MAG: hypothetical protein JW811_02815 [Clostridiales bacterium]|nr:hypothetical protein [Clostridiales bacterium]